MSFNEAIKTCYRRYFDFNGRSTRSEYWWFILYWYLCLFVFYSVVNLIIVVNDSSDDHLDSIGFGIFLIWIVLTFIPALAVRVRRLHDVGYSGLWLLALLIPYVGALAALFLFAITLFPSDDDNRWGLSPDREVTHVENINL